MMPDPDHYFPEATEYWRDRALKAEAAMLKLMAAEEVEPDEPTWWAFWRRTAF